MRYAVKYFFGMLEDLGKDSCSLSTKNIASIGETASVGLWKYGIVPYIHPVKESSEGLIEHTLTLRINKILLFGVIEESLKYETGTYANTPDNLTVRAVRAIKSNFPSVKLNFPNAVLAVYQVSEEYLRVNY